MHYPELQAARAAYTRGENVSASLREAARSPGNTASIIEVAYDMQAGSYVELVEADRASWMPRMAAMARVLREHVEPGDRVLDVGTGEMTTLAGVGPSAFRDADAIYACDISWSRLVAGGPFLNREVGALADRVQPLVADLFSLPLADSSIDLVWTAHALEPNGGLEVEALAELLRVARRRLVLFEPSYENNTHEGRARMREHGYVQDLPGAIVMAGGTCDALFPMANPSNPLNPTFVHIVTPPAVSTARPEQVWVCPTTRTPLVVNEHHAFAAEVGLAYPVLEGIPVLRTEAAILASAMKG